MTFVLLAGATAFPNMVTATDPRHSLTVYQAASSPKTMRIGLLIVAIGVPLVITYMAIIYWTFRGKVRLAELDKRPAGGGRGDPPAAGPVRNESTV